MDLNKENKLLMNQLQILKEENEKLKKENIEYGAVEFYIMFMLENNGEYEEILNAHLRKGHLRKGHVMNGIWIDE